MSLLSNLYDFALQTAWVYIVNCILLLTKLIEIALQKDSDCSGQVTFLPRKNEVPETEKANYTA